MNAPTDKFRRYRAKKKAQGLREVRLWVPDIHAPGFREEMERQAELLRGTPGELDAMVFAEALFAETPKDLD
jgi:hypothetical protein